jgi:hypothetical protein
MNICGCLLSWLSEKIAMILESYLSGFDLSVMTPSVTKQNE